MEGEVIKIVGGSIEPSKGSAGLRTQVSGQPVTVSVAKLADETFIEADKG